VARPCRLPRAARAAGRELRGAQSAAGVPPAVRGATAGAVRPGGLAQLSWQGGQVGTRAVPPGRAAGGARALRGGAASRGQRLRHAGHRGPAGSRGHRHRRGVHARPRGGLRPASRLPRSFRPGSRAPGAARADPVGHPFGHRPGRQGQRAARARVVDAHPAGRAGPGRRADRVRDRPHRHRHRPARGRRGVPARRGHGLHLRGHLTHPVVPPAVPHGRLAAAAPAQPAARPRPLLRPRRRPDRGRRPRGLLRAGGHGPLRDVTAPGPR